MEKIENKEQENVFQEKQEVDMSEENKENKEMNEGNPITPDMDLSQDQALGVLIQAARIGQKAGVYELEDAEIISKAIRVFLPKKQ